MASKGMNAQLLSACRSGNGPLLTRLLGQLVEAPGSVVEPGTGYSLLHAAAETGQAHLVTRLIAAGCSASSRSKQLATPATIAASKGHLGVLQELAVIDAAALRLHKANAWSALHHAAVNGHVECVTLLLSIGAPLEEANKEGSTPLMLAAREGHLNVLRALLDGGADIGSRTKQGRTPLLAAVAAGRFSAAELLCERGAALDARDSSGVTVWHEAVALGWSNESGGAVLDMLLSRVPTTGALRAARESRDVTGKTALHYAAMAAEGAGDDSDRSVSDPSNRSVTDPSNRSVSDPSDSEPTTQSESGAILLGCIPMLLRAGWEIDAADDRGGTPLYYAVALGHLRASAALLGAGARLGGGTVQRTLWHAASMCKGWEITALLLAVLLVETEGAETARRVLGQGPLPGISCHPVLSLGINVARQRRPMQQQHFPQQGPVGQLPPPASAAALLRAILETRDAEGRTPLEQAQVLQRREAEGIWLEVQSFADSHGS